MIIFDANVLIALTLPADASHRAAVDLIDEHEWDEFGASALTLAEVLVRPSRDGDDRRVRDVMESLGLQVMPLGAAASVRVAGVRATTKLRLPDAVVLHTAEDQHAMLATFDERLARAAATRGVARARVIGPPFARRPGHPERPEPFIPGMLRTVGSKHSRRRSADSREKFWARARSAQ